MITGNAIHDQAKKLPNNVKGEKGTFATPAAPSTEAPPLCQILHEIANSQDRTPEQKNIYVSRCLRTDLMSGS